MSSAPPQKSNNYIIIKKGFSGLKKKKMYIWFDLDVYPAPHKRWGGRYPLPHRSLSAAERGRSEGSFPAALPWPFLKTHCHLATARRNLQQTSKACKIWFFLIKNALKHKYPASQRSDRLLQLAVGRPGQCLASPRSSPSAWHFQPIAAAASTSGTDVFLGQFVLTPQCLGLTLREGRKKKKKVNNFNAFSTNRNAGEMVTWGSLLHHNPVSMPLCKEIWSQLLSWAQIQNSWFLFWFLPRAAHGITLSFINLLVTTSLNTGQLLSAVRWLLQSNTHPMPICREGGGEGVQVFASHLSTVGTAGMVQSHKLMGKRGWRNGQELSW